MASQPLPLTLTLPSSLSSSHHNRTVTLFTNGASFTGLRHRRTSTTISLLVPSVGTEDTELRVSSFPLDDEPSTPQAQDLEYVAQIKRILGLLKKNRDMLFGEVKLTIMIEDPRDIERRRLLGIEDPDGPTREDLVAALEELDVNNIFPPIFCDILGSGALSHNPILCTQTTLKELVLSYFV